MYKHHNYIYIYIYIYMRKKTHYVKKLIQERNDVSDYCIGINIITIYI